MTKVAEYTAEAAKAGGPGDASLGMLFRRLTLLPVVTVAKLRGRARGAGGEFLISLPTPAEVRADAALFQQLVRGDKARQRTAELFDKGFQTRGDTERELGDALGRLKAVD